MTQNVQRGMLSRNSDAVQVPLFLFQLIQSISHSLLLSLLMLSEGYLQDIRAHVVKMTNKELDCTSQFQSVNLVMPQIDSWRTCMNK
jgi:hypothetical protein